MGVCVDGWVMCVGEWVTWVGVGGWVLRGLTNHGS